VLTAPQRAEINRIMADNSAALWKTTYDGVEIGAAALGETLRYVRKLTADEMTDEDRALLRALVHTSLAIFIALKQLSSRFRIARIAYFGDYAYFLAPQVFAARNGIPLTNVSYAYNRDIDHRYLLLRPRHGITHMLEQVDCWDRYRDMPIDAETVSSI